MSRNSKDSEHNQSAKSHRKVKQKSVSKVGKNHLYRGAKLVINYIRYIIQKARAFRVLLQQQARESALHEVQMLDREESRRAGRPWTDPNSASSI